MNKEVRKNQNDWYNYLNSDEYQPFKNSKTKKEIIKEQTKKMNALNHDRYVIAQTAYLEQIKRDYKKRVFKSILEMLEYYPFRYNNMWKSYGQLSEAKKSYGRNWAKQLLRE